MFSSLRPVALLATAVAMAGCASLPHDRGYAETGQLVESRLGMTPVWSTDKSPALPDIPAEPLDADEAIRLAFAHNPRVRQEYARLGLGRAELEEARRVSNPSFGYAHLEPGEGGGSQITRSFSWDLASLMLLPSRKRFAAGELERIQNVVATNLLGLATEVEIAWFEAVSANQVAGMRDVVAKAAERSAELAQRFFDAGNINRLQLEQEYAAAAQARIAAVRATVAALRARSELAGLMGLPVNSAWSTQSKLPAPPATDFSAAVLLPVALEQRLDLAAARREVALREDALGVTRHWRWLGSVDVGYERESEIDGEVLRGPTLSLELPIFNQGQGALARAQAELQDARARLDGLVLTVQNEARLGAERVAVARDVAERYRTTLVPRREAIVARTQEQVNFMLVGVFELILARQQEFDAYQEYLEAVRDYWAARSQLRLIAGGRLPDDGIPLEPAIGVDAILPSRKPPSMDHSAHGNADAAASDPHAGHRMPGAQTEKRVPGPVPVQPASPGAGAHQHPGTSKPDSEAGPDPDSNLHEGHEMAEPERAESHRQQGLRDENEAHDHGDVP